MAIDLYYFDGDCTTPEAQAQIRENFIKILNTSGYNYICQDPEDRCTAENVVVTCDAVTDTSRRRKRRSLGWCNNGSTS